ncbi:MAG: hypothetical protein H5T59_01025 [Anaerolineae bacterium]|nr:hypothetical protein [Anaerolineae bacterium]
MRPGDFPHLLRARAGAISTAAALLALTLAVLLAVPAPGAPAPVTSAAPPRATLPLEEAAPDAAAALRVLVLVLPGIGAEQAELALADGTLHHLARLAAQGVYLPILTPPESGGTAWAGWALSAGQGAGLPEDPEAGVTCTAWKEWNARASPVWWEAEAAGHAAGLVLWPPFLPLGCARIASAQVEGWVQDLPSAWEQVSLAPAQDWQGLPFSYSEPLEGQVSLPGDGQRTGRTLYLAVLDRRNDGVALYDHVLLTDDRDAPEAGVLFRTDGWADYWVLREEGGAASFRVTEVQHGSHAALTLYRSPAYHLEVRPPALRQELLSATGPLAAPPDLEAWQQGWLTKGQVLEMTLRHERGFTKAVAFLQARGELALLWVRWTPLARAWEVLGALEPQGGEEARRFLRQVDADLGTLLRRVDLSATVVVVVFTPAQGDAKAGACIAAGRGVRPGLVEGPTPAAEVAALVRALLGLGTPSKASLPGRVLEP